MYDSISFLGGLNPVPRMLCGIGTRFVHLKELDPDGHHYCPHQEFDIGKPQILLLFPVVLNFLSFLANSISTVVLYYLPDH